MNTVKYIVLCTILLIDFIAVYVIYFSMNGPWWTYLLEPLIPLLAFLFLLTTLLSIVFKSKLNGITSFISLLLIIWLVFPLWGSVLNFSDNKYDHDDLAVLNYNVSSFYNNRNDYEVYTDPTQNARAFALLDWLSGQSFDVIALQEFYSDSASSIFNAEERIVGAGYNSIYFLSETRIKSARKSGIAIFSKWPIINRGKLFISKNRFNGAQYADVVLKSEDTVRIINIHLESAQLGYLPKSFRNASKINKIKWKWQYLRRTTVERRKQAEIVLEAAKSSPYPTLIVGDFNSQIYSGLLSIFTNSFSNAHSGKGTGMNFTYFDKRIWPIGIDHQLYSEELELKTLIIEKSNRLSNHRPVIGFYHIK